MQIVSGDKFFPVKPPARANYRADNPLTKLMILLEGVDLSAEREFYLLNRTQYLLPYSQLEMYGPSDGQWNEGDPRVQDNKEDSQKQNIKSDEKIFIIGDAAAIKNAKGEYLPAIAPVAMQQGRYVAKLITKSITGNSRKAFKYNDKGTMATIGKAKAVGVVKGIKLSGLIAWLAWSFIHIAYLIGFRNRLRVMVEWIWYYITNRPGIRLIIKYTQDSVPKT